MSGDGFRTRHDSVKNFLHQQMKFAGMSVVCEVFGMFAIEIPQEGLSRMEKGRVRQSILPDLKIMLPVPGSDQLVPTLGELKVLSSCPTHYPRNPRPQVRAVDRRSDELHSEM